MLAEIVEPKFVKGSVTAVAIKSSVFLIYALTLPLNLPENTLKSIPAFNVFATSHFRSLLIGAGR